jgi:hypothetical protein
MILEKSEVAAGTARFAVRGSPIIISVVLVEREARGSRGRAKS